MKSFILSLVFLIGFSFVGKAEHTEINKAEYFNCVNCWNHANKVEYGYVYGGGAHPYRIWSSALDHCMGTQNSCAKQLKPVVVKG